MPLAESPWRMFTLIQGRCGSHRSCQEGRREYIEFDWFRFPHGSTDWFASG